MPKAKERYPLIDGIRGIAIVNMVIFHFLYDVYIVYGQDPAWYARPPVRIWQQFICWTFILVSGFVWQWGAKTNLRRGIFINVCGGIITLVTWLVLPSEAVWFGILNFIGCAVLLMIPLSKALYKVPPLTGMLISFALFLFFRNVQQGSLGLGRLELVRLPQWLYGIKIFTPFGFPYPGFVSSDYFPMLPWMFLFIAGFFAGLIFTEHETWKKAARMPMPVLSALGRQGIWIYMIHQPVCILICMLVFR